MDNLSHSCKSQNPQGSYTKPAEMPKADVSPCKAQLKNMQVFHFSPGEGRESKQIAQPNTNSDTQNNCEWLTISENHKI